MSLRHAILGFVDLEPATGYTLRQRFEASVGAFWSATQSQIYRELHGLLEEGMVAVETIDQAGKPPRKLYGITASGKAELFGWLHSQVEPMHLRDPFLLRLVFAADLPAAALDQHLQSYIETMQATRDDYLNRRNRPEIFALARSSREAALWQLALDNGLAWCNAQLAWAQHACDVLLKVDEGKPSRRPVKKTKKPKHP